MFTLDKKRILDAILVITLVAVMGIATTNLLTYDSLARVGKIHTKLHTGHKGKLIFDKIHQVPFENLIVSGSATDISAVSGSAIIPAEQVPLSHKLTLADIYSSIRIHKVHYMRYALKNLKLKKYPTKKAKTIKKINRWTHIQVEGKVKGSLGTKYVVVRYKGKTGFVLKKQLTKKNPDVFYKWHGPKLTRSKGVNAGPSGKETYYNLPMGGVIRIMRAHGYTGRYWVRSDGVKCLGNYIMVAADQRIRPLGSHIKTSLGIGLVCDTGSFIYSNPTQIDIAVAW